MTSSFSVEHVGEEHSPNSLLPSDPTARNEAVFRDSQSLKSSDGTRRAGDPGALTLQGLSSLSSLSLASDEGSSVHAVEDENVVTFERTTRLSETPRSRQALSRRVLPLQNVDTKHSGADVKSTGAGSSDSSGSTDISLDAVQTGGPSDSSKNCRSVIGSSVGLRSNTRADSLRFLTSARMIAGKRVGAGSGKGSAPVVPTLQLAGLSSPRLTEKRDYPLLVQSARAAGRRKWVADSLCDASPTKPPWLTQRSGVLRGSSYLPSRAGFMFEDMNEDDSEEDISTFWMSRCPELQGVFGEEDDDETGMQLQHARVWLRHIWGELVYEQEKNEHLYSVTEELEHEREQLQKELLVSRVQLDTVEAQMERTNRELAEMGKKRDALLEKKYGMEQQRDSSFTAAQNAAADATVKNYITILKSENAAYRNRVAELEKELSYFQTQLAVTKVRMATVMEDREKVEKLNRYYARQLKEIDPTLVVDITDENRLQQLQPAETSTTPHNRTLNVPASGGHTSSTRKYTGFFQRVHEKAFGTSSSSRPGLAPGTAARRSTVKHEQATSSNITATHEPSPYRQRTSRSLHNEKCRRDSLSSSAESNGPGDGTRSSVSSSSGLEAHSDEPRSSLSSYASSATGDDLGQHGDGECPRIHVQAPGRCKSTRFVKEQDDLKTYQPSDMSEKDRDVTVHTVETPCGSPNRQSQHIAASSPTTTSLSSSVVQNALPKKSSGIPAHESDSSKGAPAQRDNGSSPLPSKKKPSGWKLTLGFGSPGSTKHRDPPI